MLCERIRQARDLCGLTQVELAEKINIAQSAIAQIEAGLYAPSDNVLDAIATETGFDLTFLRQEEAPANFPASSLLYRSQSRVTARQKAMAHRMAQLMFEFALRMREQLRDIPVMLPRLPDEEPITSAKLTRSHLNLSPDTPIPNVIAALERAGVLVLRLPLNIEGLDGFSTWAGPKQNIPVICLVGERLGYRDRVTAGEEAGHLVMHTPLRVSTSRADAQARSFAGEFLFPEEAMRLELPPPITLAGFAESKHRWQVSISFQVVHANRIGLITQNQYRYLMQQINAKGWRKEEEGDSNVLTEKPKAFLKMAKVVYGSPLDLSRIRKDTGVPLALLRKLFAGAVQKQNEGPGLTLVRKPTRLLA